MLDTQLLLIEGIWGSGKSTTTQNLYLHLTQQGFTARRLFDEADADHPCYEVGDSDPQAFTRTFSERWANLIEEARCDEGLMLLLESPFLNGAVQYFIQHGMPDRAVIEHTLALARQVLPLRPTMIHLYSPDTPRVWRRICDIRGPEWEEFMCGWPPRWNQTHGTDFTDIVEYLQRLRSLNDAIFDQLPFRKLAIDVGERNWPEYYRQISAFLELPALSSHPLPLNDYIGTYRMTQRCSGAPADNNATAFASGDYECTIATRNGHLEITGLFGKPRALLPNISKYPTGHASGDSESFHTPGMSLVEILFHRAPTGTVDRFTVGDHLYGMPTGGNWESLKGTVWRKQQ